MSDKDKDKKVKTNPKRELMREIRIEKVTLNVGCGADQAKIERAKKLLEMLTKMKPLVTRSKRRSTFGVSKGKPVGVRVTLRGKQASDFLKLALTGVENRIKASQFDPEGNFSFGIAEYIDIPGIKYQHSIGMLGFDVAVTLERAGFRIKRRRLQKKRLPARHKINKAEAINWLKRNFEVEVIES